MIHDRPVLQAIPHFCTTNAKRYVIQDLVSQHVWTGHGFSADWRLAVLYAHPNEACHDMRQIMLHVFDGEPLSIYEAPCRVEVFGAVDMEHVQHWLSRASVLKMRTDDYGNGPSNSLVLPAIYWAEMKRTDS